MVREALRNPPPRKTASDTMSSTTLQDSGGYTNSSYQIPSPLGTSMQQVTDQSFADSGGKVVVPQTVPPPQLDIAGKYGTTNISSAAGTATPNASCQAVGPVPFQPMEDQLYSRRDGRKSLGEPLSRSSEGHRYSTSGAAGEEKRSVSMPQKFGGQTPPPQVVPSRLRLDLPWDEEAGRQMDEESKGGAGEETYPGPRPVSTPGLRSTISANRLHMTSPILSGRRYVGAGSSNNTFSKSPRGSFKRGSQKTPSLAGTFLLYATRPGGKLNVFAAARDGQVSTVPRSDKVHMVKGSAMKNLPNRLPLNCLRALYFITTTNQRRPFS